MTWNEFVGVVEKVSPSTNYLHASVIYTRMMIRFGKIANSQGAEMVFYLDEYLGSVVSIEDAVDGDSIVTTTDEEQRFRGATWTWLLPCYGYTLVCPD